MWGRASVTVAGEPTLDVNITLRPARTISGVVVFEMARPPDLSRARISMTITPAPSAQQIYVSSPTAAQVGPDGRFLIRIARRSRSLRMINGADDMPWIVALAPVNRRPRVCTSSAASVQKLATPGTRSRPVTSPAICSQIGRLKPGGAELRQSRQSPSDRPQDPLVAATRRRAHREPGRP